MNYQPLVCISLSILFSSITAAAFAQPHDPCSPYSGVALVRESPFYYNSCGFPAASISAKQIATGNENFSAGPTSCMAQVCLFDAVSGRRLDHWNTNDKTLADLSEHLAPLSELLKQKAFQPMVRMEYTPQKRGGLHRGSGLTVTLSLPTNASSIVVEGDGYMRTVHRFKSRIARCEGEADQRVVPQSVVPWALEGFPAVVVGAQYYGAEAGCTWMDWIVVPLKKKTKKQPSAKSAQHASQHFFNHPPNSVRPFASDDPLGDFVMGRRIEATDANGNPLYRLRLNLTTDDPLGGSGGVPAGGIAGEFPGWFGTKGANGALNGLPAR